MSRGEKPCPPVWLDAATLAGAQRAEAGRVGAMVSLGAAPDACSDAVVGAPAQRPLDPWAEREIVQTPNGPRERRVQYAGGAPARVRSPLRHLERIGRPRQDGAPLFTEVQHEAAEAYAALAERVGADGCTMLNLTGRVGGGERDTIEARIARRDRLEHLDALIGKGLVLDPSGVRAQPGRRPLTRLALVRRGVVEGWTLRHVLGWARWQGNETRHRGRLIDGLRVALDAMAGG